MTKKTKLPEPVGGLHILYSPVNMAYFVMWHDQPLRILPKDEAIAYFNEITERIEQ